MGRLYRPVSERAKALYGDDDIALDLSVVDERDALTGGHLEVVPRPYRVLVDNLTLGEQDSVVDLALEQDQETALVSGGFLEPVEPPAPAKKAAAKKAAK